MYSTNRGCDASTALGGISFHKAATNGRSLRLRLLPLLLLPLLLLLLLARLLLWRSCSRARSMSNSAL